VARPILALLAVLLATSSVAAEVHDTPFDLPGDDATVRVPFVVRHPGAVVVDAAWAGPRVISFRLDLGASPGPPSAVRRSGPSPQRVTAEVTPSMLARGPLSATLHLRALPAQDAARGTLTLTLPDSPEEVARRELELHPPPPPPPPPDPWTQPVAAPLTADAGTLALVDGVEALRRLVIVDDAAGPDSCGWQADLLRALAGWRDARLAGGEGPSPATRALLRKMAKAVDTVEAMTTSEHPLIAGPAPGGGIRRRAWLSLRAEELRPILGELDALAEAVGRLEASDLEGASWPARLVGCLTACQRHFDERVAAADPSQASHGDLADSQWPAIRAAGAALGAVAADE
jgi:hypothetical protein